MAANAHMTRSKIKVAAIAAYEGVSARSSRNRTNRTMGSASFRQPSTAKSVLGGRKGVELSGRLLGAGTSPASSGSGLGGRPPAAAGMGGVGRSTSVSHIGSGAAAAERENRRMREMILELSLKLDTLLAKQ